MDARRRIPAVGAVLSRLEASPEAASWSHRALVNLVRAELARRRRSSTAPNPGAGAEAPADEGVEATVEAVASACRRRLQRLDTPSPRRVVNATGVVIHTNLGRAVAGARVAERLEAVARHPCDLEIDLDTAARGRRLGRVAELLELMFPDHGALAVNNNAAAVLLVLAVAARGREVIVSRGELVEIGGSFRVPEILEQSGAILREVGTTNRTHPEDYERAVGAGTGAILKVWPSNYRVVGFTRSVDVAELAPVARRAGVPLLVDQGCGRPFDDASGPASEPSVESLLAAGATAVCFSGDKLLGGPQAGLVVGEAEFVARAARHPLARALRVDKFTLAALEPTLAAWLARSGPRMHLPVAAMLAASREELERRATELARRIDALGPRIAAAAVPGSSRVGGGAAPEVALETCVVAVALSGMSDAELARRLRRSDPPVVARTAGGRVLLDPRTLSAPGDEDAVVAALAAVAAGGGAGTAKAT